MFILLLSLLLLSLTAALNPEADTLDVADTLIISEMPAVSSEDTLNRDNALSDTKDAESDTIDTDKAGFASVTYSHSCLKVIRENKRVASDPGSELMPGDIVETCAKHFAVLNFQPEGSMILFPSSIVVVSPDGTKLTLKSAEILFEYDTITTSFPEIIHCFDESLYHVEGSPPLSFGVHCRGESGMILTSKRGSLWWNNHGKPFEISESTGIMGRVTTANYSRITLPEQPVIMDSIVVTPATARDTASINGSNVTLRWTPIAMTDQYLVHIYQNDSQKTHHVVTLHHSNQFSTILSGAGDFEIRVMAIDFYGVTGAWSLPYSFVIDDSDSAAKEESRAFES